MAAGRIDVFARRPRRRTHDGDFKARLAAESHRPGAAGSDVARRAGVHPQLLFGWRREARAGRLALPEDLLPMFAEALPCDAEHRPVEAAFSGPVTAAAEVIVELGNGVRKRIGPGVPVERAAALVSTLKASA
ncbi:MAG: transposase [Paracoccaceae bacterium]